MDDIQELIQQKEQLLADVEARIEALKETERELNLQAQELRQQLLELQRQTIEPVEEAAVHDRRTEPRRRGNLLSVFISRVHGDPALINGWVVDRSRGGLRLLLDEQMDVGTLVKVCPSLGPGLFNWHRVEVKNVSQEKGSWLLGCKFVQQLSWESLRMFG